MANEDSKNSGIPPVIYATACFLSFSGGLYQPYLNIYAVEREATYGEMGIITAVSTAAPTILQPIWGGLSDKIGKRKPFMFFGYLVGSTLILLFLFAKTPMLFALFLAIHFVILSAAVPAWNALLGKIIPEKVRGKALGKINGIAFAARVSATAIAGIVMTWIMGATLESQYTFAFTAAAIFGVLGSLLILKFREPVEDGGTPVYQGLKRAIKETLKNKYFRRLCSLEVIFGVAMSMSWPYFSVVMIRKLQASKFEIAIASIIFGVTASLSQFYLGKLADRFGRKPIIVVSRIMLPLYPFLFILSQNMYYVYLANIIGGISNGLSMVAISAYILDVSGEHERGTYFATYNTITGLAFSIGPMFSGYLGMFFQTFQSEIQALNTVLTISVILRAITALSFLLLKETRRIAPAKVPLIPPLPKAEK